MKPAMRRYRWLGLLGFAFLIGCGGPGDLMETAQFEELQHNTAHARQLYEQVVREFPGTPEAQAAADRLRALDLR
jgi:hypothetical protein